jgi:hypothetical protein
MSKYQFYNLLKKIRVGLLKKILHLGKRFTHKKLDVCLRCICPHNTEVEFPKRRYTMISSVLFMETVHKLFKEAQEFVHVDGDRIIDYYTEIPELTRANIIWKNNRKEIFRDIEASG